MPNSYRCPFKLIFKLIAPPSVVKFVRLFMFLCVFVSWDRSGAFSRSSDKLLLVNGVKFILVASTCNVIFALSFLIRKLRKGSWDLFRLCPPPPPSTLCSPQLHSIRHYMANHYVKILHVLLGGANNMHPLSGGAQTEQIRILL